MPFIWTRGQFCSKMGEIEPMDKKERKKTLLFVSCVTEELLTVPTLTDCV